MKVMYEASFDDDHPAAEQMHQSAVNVARYVFNISSPETRREGGKRIVYGKGHPVLEEIIRRHIRDVLSESDGNKTKAAKTLGLKRTTLVEKMKKLGMM